MRAVDSATWTSGDPVSLSARLCSAISLPLTSFSTAKLAGQYTGRSLTDVFDRPIRSRVRPGAPRSRAVDHDRVRVAERIVFGRHQPHATVRARTLRGARVVGLDGKRFAVDQDRLARPRHRLGR